ncbi:hypothetical protein PR048_011385 [Dryococelus australis]|uniref:PiggyBac transposable element-derived protein domain-containing protein n=1 Tax=Dryococelus australis TaxID=614101 RepID=A0ABQ9HM13_9NEOP|nr:hypothetical protein PR048_011385 [Dryococelus australis]
MDKPKKRGGISSDGYGGVLRGKLKGVLREKENGEGSIMVRRHMTDEDALKYFYSLGEADIPSGSEASFCSDRDGGDCEERQDCSGIYDVVAETPQMRIFIILFQTPMKQNEQLCQLQELTRLLEKLNGMPEETMLTTNQYAIQCGKVNFKITKKEIETFLGINNLMTCIHYNFKITKKEIETFLGINNVMTCIHYPSIRMYWSSSQSMRLEFISNAMSLTRFEEIKRFIHLVNNESKPYEKATDCFWKLKTFIRGKPKRWGFKVRVKTSYSGYIQCFKFYSGKDKNFRSTLGPVGDVLRLCHDIKGKNHKFLPLIRQLRSHDSFVLGTFRMNRPPGVAAKLVPGKLLARGCLSVATSDGNITVVRWMDKEVHTISSFAGAEPESEVQRWDRKAKDVIPRPFSDGENNKYMGGVDLADRMIAHYPHGLKSKKWYLHMFFHLLNMALVNAWLSYKEDNNVKIPFVTFKASIAHTPIVLGRRDAKKIDDAVVRDDMPPLLSFATVSVTNTINPVFFLHSIPLWTTCTVVKNDTGSSVYRSPKIGSNWN